MKKLSIEEKAKRYDEAIERARLINNKGTWVRCGSTGPSICEQIFPELKESEDERTWIINYLNNRILNSTIIAEKENLKKAIAWLEKQGEQKPAWSEEDDMVLNSILDSIQREGVLEKKRKTDWLKSLKCKVQPQLKSDWSEEDVYNFTSALGCVAFCRERAKEKDDYNHCLDWLKSLKDRVQPQPKQEWSEEDAKALNRISTILVDASEVKNWWKEYRLIERDEMIRLTDFLKSLKDRYTWKPSDEQMDALWSATEKYLESDNENVRKLRGEVLESLYEDLKKLKG